MWLTAFAYLILVKCVSAQWWSDAVYYRVLVDSFKDSDGDGLGDLRGVTKQMSYIKGLGADALILSPIQAKSRDCTRPGTIDFTEIDSRYGNEESFSKLVDKSKKLGLKVLVTLEVQSVSVASEFVNSSAVKKPGFEDWIVWRDGNETNPPESQVGVEKWVWNDVRNSYWASNNDETMVNLCSEDLTETLKRSICTWIQRAVSGFLLNPDFKLDQSCGVRFLKAMAATAADCTRLNKDRPITLVETALDVSAAANYYVDGSGVISNLNGRVRRTAPDLALAIQADVLFRPQDMSLVWPTSSNDDSRVTSRCGSEMVDATNMITLLLPGAAIIHQGDELGAADTIVEWATAKCWPARTTATAAPFPWDDSPSAGFTSGEPWLPLAPNYRYANAKTEFAHEQSHLGVVRVAVAMRKSPAYGPYYEITRLGDALAILRWGTTGSLLLVSNVAYGECDVELSRIHGLAYEMIVVTSSGGSNFSPGNHVNINKTLKLAPGETMLLAGAPRHCGGPGPVDKIVTKLSEGWQRINRYLSNL